LLEREAYFGQMADKVPVMIWVTDPKGDCMYLNKPWYEYTGQSLEEALGMGWLSATHPEDNERGLQIFISANERRVPFSLTVLAG
jgi:PAS domain S-box-containing protein